MKMNMMLWINFYIIPFFFIINIMSIFINNNYIMWILLEMNNINFITLMILMSNKLNYYKKNLSNIFTYMIIQTISSLLIMINFIDSMSMINNFYFFEIGILIKLGIFPFHYWVIMIMNNMNWIIIFMLSSIQKIIPLMMIYLSEFSNKMNFILILSILLCSFWMMKQNNFKKIIAYSSIINSSWMMMMMFLNKFNCMFYFLIYSLTMLCLILILIKFNINNNKFIYSMNFMPFKFKFLFMLLMMALMGMPPMSMMWNMILIMLTLKKMMYSTIILIMLILSKLMMMISYLYISYSFFFLKKMNWKNLYKYSNKFWMKSNLMFIMISLITLMIFISIYLLNTFYN
uniref:NADH-ubiquinone oxidoreductase chain 2 n=1 Tax=Cerceris quinquefasciata TaxID=2026451 RepID=A0A8B0JP49_9HYME|nr:NADH dehydrogenase subunit 2 [Cerceris quinquefasciata]QTV22624.1 NADH dehydrogenase subunit 2 [Cerceris quinquefasciata]